MPGLLMFSLSRNCADHYLPLVYHLAQIKRWKRIRAGGGRRKECKGVDKRAKGEGAGGINGNDSAIMFSEVNTREMRDTCLYLERSYGY